MISGKGGVLGPDLSGIALSEFPDQIRRSVMEPDAAIDEDFRTVTIVTRKNEKIVGVLKMEDNFSVQVMKKDGQYALLLRSEIADIRYEDRSVMPRPNLQPADLQNLLAFLDRQRVRRAKFSLTFQNY